MTADENEQQVTRMARRILVGGALAFGCLPAPPGAPAADANREPPRTSPDAGTSEALVADPSTFEVEKWNEDEARRAAEARCGPDYEVLGSRTVSRTKAGECKDGLLAGVAESFQTTRSGGSKKVCTNPESYDATVYRFRCRKGR